MEPADESGVQPKVASSIACEHSAHDGHARSTQKHHEEHAPRMGGPPIEQGADRQQQERTDVQQVTCRYHDIDGRRAMVARDPSSMTGNTGRLKRRRLAPYSLAAVIAQLSKRMGRPVVSTSCTATSSAVARLSISTRVVRVPPSQGLPPGHACSS
jgi:hypothetical protein